MERNVGAHVRAAPLLVSELFDFSLFELFAVASPFFVFAVVLYALRGFESPSERRRRFLTLVALLLIVASLAALALGIPGQVSAPAVSPVGSATLAATARYLAERVAATVPEAGFVSLDEGCRLVFSAYSEMRDARLTLTPRMPRPKRLRASFAASRLHILALYSFPTGEININLAAPEYTHVFSVAHEMAHLFGVSDEGAADLFAFRASVATGERSVMYGAYLTAFGCVAAALAQTDAVLYRELYASLPAAARLDMRSYLEFWSENRGAASEAADRLNAVLTEASGSLGYSGFVPLLAEYLVECGSVTP